MTAGSAVCCWHMGRLVGCGKAEHARRPLTRKWYSMCSPESLIFALGLRLLPQHLGVENRRRGASCRK